MKLHSVLQEINIAEGELLPSDTTFKGLAQLEQDSPLITSMAGYLPRRLIVRSIAGSPTVSLNRDGVWFSLQGSSQYGVTELTLQINGAEYSAWVSSALIQIGVAKTAD